MCKAKDLIASPGKYNRATAYGAAKYIQGINYDSETSEIIESKSSLHINEVLIREEEKFDGYYMIVTSEMDKSDDEVLEAVGKATNIDFSKKYRTLSEIKKITGYSKNG